MSPQLATIAFAIGVLGLFWLCREKDQYTSPALWLPVLWLSIGGSRGVSSWLGGASVASAETYLEGSPLDRNIFTILIVLSIGVLISRGQRTADHLKRNPPLLVFFGYCLASVLWSDYPFVTFKHWTKVLGNFTMVLIVLTEDDSRMALKRFITRTAFILIPASVLIVKYYPLMGRYYDKWEGRAFYSGVTEDKNMLGAICMVLGLGLVWRFISTFRETGPKLRRLIALGTVLAMIGWLLHIADSATSFGCFALGSAVIVTVNVSRRARPKLVHCLVAGLASAGGLVYLLQDAFAFLVVSLGRNTTLTGRTELWKDLREMANTHPLLGAGFESFFLGDRLEFLWQKHWWHPTEAHNGYLDTYLTLGLVGLALLAVVMLTGYRNIVNVYRTDPGPGSYRLAILLISPIYNITEAAFKVMNPVWILFMLAVTALPPRVEEPAACEAGARPEPDKPRFYPLERPARLAAPAAHGFARTGRAAASQP
jgi:exopolysaccharide production protein ExoQ